MRVLVVGAGPVGMTAALLLARQGVPVTVLEAAPSRELVGSRSICVQRDVLDVLERAGVGSQVADVGVTWTRGRTYYREHVVGEITFPEVGEAAFPPFVNTPQTIVELLLEQRIAEEPLVDLYYDQEVVDLSQDDDGVSLSTSDTGYRGTHCVAADGPRSAVRDLLGLPFDGMSFAERFLIADIRADLGFAQPERRFYFDPPWNPGRQVLLHPQPGGVWRIDWQVPADFDLANEDLDSRIRAIVGDADYEIVWLSVYRFHQRRVPRMRVGRVLLAGDAAHVMSPFGARGLNSGIADADNLAWKIALDRENLAGPALLASYDDERGAAAAENLRITGETMRFLVPRTPEDRERRLDVLTRAVDDESARPEIDSGKLATPFTYTDSPLTTTGGGLCPDARLMCGKRFRELGTFVVLTHWCDWRPADEWERSVVGEVIPLDQEDDTVLVDALRLNPRQAVVVRPDGHVAAVVTEPQGGIAPLITKALRRATGW
ncbi:FAD-dependent monooxygenase [Actinophytocola algeriensis]|uniref:2-polyprenyl-6-methoxyphenol hydroxylase-like FAD-dependent oxidoreductase n=1 Tax=Actinophytocola algeriensis TaxID=1768010 RepID=A0A7W7QEB6_9PSEU|nr:FAD-dependent monooxygenase [Actinophytocola algeriensis]MBB4912081.1 2-polyprenyl-6-methoxyphenol hydroxylase-like FAD-dependent oxidoreductase [Actinophytocola algeriensis]MBE1477427.1 2-polyprenyl-6-methoxyphenol hydroxylase-like FAD-dependent oxidoreductase [Actinophytocola algeriensis]